MMEGNSTDHNSVEDVLLVNEISGKTGPQLTVPSATLAATKDFTIELWFAFETMTARNLTILGMSNKDWTQGFGIAGVLNATGGSLACIMDTITTTGKATCGVLTPLCKSFSTSVRVWHHFACSRAGNATARLTYDGTSSLSSTTFSTSMGEQFGTGNFVLGTRETSSTKIAGFAGYVREIRLWSRWLSEEEITARIHLYNYACENIIDRRLSPMEHGSLIGYWPLTGGRDGDLFEVSGHSQQSVSVDSANEAGRAVYGTGAYDWIRMPALWTLALCRKEYVYHPRSDSCVKARPHLAPYFKLNALKVIADYKDVPTTFTISMSVWVYHTSLQTSAYIFEVANITSLILSKPAIITDPTTVSAAYGNPTKADYRKIVFPLAADPPTLRWVHYGLITKTGMGSILFFEDYISPEQTFTSPTVLPESLAFYVGSTLYGYLREAKVWTSAITPTEMLYERFQYSITIITAYY